MNSKTLRSLSLSVISLAGQFGVRITVEQLEKKISQGQIKSEKELKNTLNECTKLKQQFSDLEQMVQKFRV